MLNLQLVLAHNKLKRKEIIRTSWTAAHHPYHELQSGDICKVDIREVHINSFLLLQIIFLNAPFNRSTDSYLKSSETWNLTIFIWNIFHVSEGNGVYRKDECKHQSFREDYYSSSWARGLLSRWKASLSPWLKTREDILFNLDSAEL